MKMGPVTTEQMVVCSTNVPNVLPDLDTIYVIEKTNSTPPDWNWMWDAMVFDDAFCQVQNYKVTCRDPGGVDHDVLANTAGGSLCDIFTADTRLDHRLITIPDHSLIQNSHEGVYTFTVEGTNALSPANPGVYTLELTIEPNCAITTITAPVEFSFANSFGNGPFIGTNTFESGTWTLDQFTLSVTTICDMSFHLVHSTDDGATYSETTVPSYISMSPASGGTTQPFSVSIDGTLTTNEQFTGKGDEVKFAIKAQVVGHPIEEMTTFSVIFFPNCKKTHVKIQDVIVLQSQTVHLGLISETLLISSDDTDLTKAVISNFNDDPLLEVFDKAACIFEDHKHRITVYSQTEDILSLYVEQELPTDDKFEISTRTDVVNGDVDSTSGDACKLTDLGQVECTISYQIKAWTYNSTWTLAEGDVVFVNECLSLKTLYEAAGNADPVWQWPTANKDEFDMGYALRQPEVSFLLPQVFPVLNSGLSVFAECGDITYTVENPDYEVFSLDSTTITVDNSQPIRVTAYTVDSSKVMPLQAVNEYYQFHISVQIEKFKDHEDAVTYEYFSSAPLESSRQADLRFYLRDFCREPIFTETSLVIPDNSTVYDYQADPTLGQLMLEKKILSTATVFYLTYLDYTTEEEQWTGVTYPCGPPEEIIYETQLVTEDNEIFADVITQNSNPALWLTDEGLKYTIRPLYTEQASGAYYFTVKATVSEPVEAIGTETVGSTLMKVFMKIKPCEVLEVTQGNQIFQNYNLLHGVDTASLEFSEFQQVPLCNYTMNYNITIAEVPSSGAPVDFEDLTLGARLNPPIATFQPELRRVDFFSSHSSQISKTFTVFVTGHAEIDPDLQDPVFGVGNSFNVAFSNEPPEPPPVKPTIINFLSQFEVEAGSVETFTIGEPQDYQLRPVIVTWDFVTAEQDFIQLEEEYGSNFIYFKVSPPKTTSRKKVQIELLLEVENADPPLKQTFYIEIQVLEYVSPVLPVVNTTELEVSTARENEESTETFVSISQVDQTGLFEIIFSEDILWPEDTLSWTSSNEGADFFGFLFAPSDETLDLLEYEQFEIELNWQVVQVSSKVLTINMDFSHPEIVSKYFRKGHIDFVELQVNEKMDSDLNVKVVNKEEKLDARVLPQVDKDQIKLSLQTVQLVEGGVMTVFGANLVSTLLSAQVIQFLWGIINSLQLIVLTVLYSLLIPTVCYDVLISIMKLTNLDLIEVDFLFDVMFNFRETQPVNTTFEQAGYQSTNFFVEIGPLFFLILVYLTWMPIRKLIQWCGEKTAGGNCLTRRMRQKSNFKLVIVRFFFEGCVELGLATLICITKISEDNFKAPWETVSTCFALLLALIFLLFPFYLARAKRLLLSETEAGVKNCWFAALFPDLKIKDTELLFTVFYFIRRYVMVLSICIPPQNEIIQSFVHILVSLASLAYLLSVHPFALPSKNWQEIVNELAVLLASYHLPVFSEWTKLDQKDEAGWSMLGIIAAMAAFNILLILVLLIKSAIRTCRIKRSKKSARDRQIALKEAKEIQEAAKDQQSCRLDIQDTRDQGIESGQQENARK